MLLSMVLGIVIGYNPDTENFMAMSRIMNFPPFFLAGYYEKDGGFFLRYGKQRNPKEAKICNSVSGGWNHCGIYSDQQTEYKKIVLGNGEF